MSRLRFNGLTAALGATLAIGATTATLANVLSHSDGTAVPTIANGDYLPLTLLNPDGSLAEIVYVTGYTTGTTAITAMVRAREGTVDQSHASGAEIRHAPTVFDHPHDPVYSPTVAQLAVDEFNDGAVDAAWVDCDPTNAPAASRTWTEDGDAMSCLLAAAGDAAGSMRGRVRPLSAIGGAMSSGDAFVTRLGRFPLANTQLAGLVLSSAGTVAGNQLVASLFTSSSLLNFGYTTLASWASGTLTVVGNLGLDVTSMWVRLVYLGANVWRMDMSLDGISWVKSATTVTWAFTPTHVGLSAAAWGLTSTIKSTATFDTLRRVSGVT